MASRTASSTDDVVADVRTRSEHWALAGIEGIRRLGGIGHRSSPVGVSLGPPGGTAAACFRASLLACLRSRRSRTAFSRLSFAIVVFFFELEAMHSVPSMEFRARR